MEIESEFLKGYSDRDLLVTSLERIKGLRLDFDARDVRYQDLLMRHEASNNASFTRVEAELLRQDSRIDDLKSEHDQRQGANKTWRIGASLVAAALMGLQIASYLK